MTVNDTTLAMPATHFSDMPMLATPRPTTSPPFHRRRKSWARKIERCCCATFTYFPLLFVYGLTTWAVYIQLHIAFVSGASTGAFVKAGLGLGLYLLADISYTTAVFTNPGSPLDQRRAAGGRIGRRRKDGGYEGLPLHEDDVGVEEEPLTGAVPPEWMSSVTAKSTGKPRYCKKCRCVKPDRSHHCSTCGRCVLKMDHHCPWLATCVGLRNYKAFLLFLSYVSLFCWVCFASTAGWVWAEIVDARAMDPGLLVVNTIILAVLSGIIGLVLSGFTGWHIYLTLTGQTTIESLEKTRYLTPLRKTLEPAAPNHNAPGRSYLNPADDDEEAAENQPLGERLKEIHANALPGVLRPEEGDTPLTPSNPTTNHHNTTSSSSPAQTSLTRSYASLEAARERARYTAYLDERDSESLPNAFDHGWRRNLLHVLGPAPALWFFPVANSTGDGWSWDVSAKWTAARERVAREREARERRDVVWDRHAGSPPRREVQPQWRWNGGAGFVDQAAAAAPAGRQQEQFASPPPPPPLDRRKAPADEDPNVQDAGAAEERRARQQPQPSQSHGWPDAAAMASTANWNDVPEEFLTSSASSRRGERGRRKGD